MEMNQSQTFLHGTYLSLTQYFFLSKNIKVFQWLLKSQFLSLTTKVKSNNGNKTKWDIFPWVILKCDTTSFLSKNTKVFHWLPKLKSLNSSLKWTEKMELNQSQTFFHGTYSSLTPYFFHQQFLMYFFDFKNWKVPVLWLKWTQTMEMKQNQTFFHHTNSTLIPNLCQYHF